MKSFDVIFEKEVKITSSDAFIIIDVQNDFIPGGSLPVNKGDEIIDGINEIMSIFKNFGAKIVLSQDWHPPNHASFASVHPGLNPFDEYSSTGIGPVLWPDHCVQGQSGAEFHHKLNIKLADVIIRKGNNPLIDSYSAFIENDKKTKTDLPKFLKSTNIKRIFLAGLALDYCVRFTAIDGKNLGFEVYIIIDLTRSIDNSEDNISSALKEMSNIGIKFIKSKTIFK